MWGAVWVQSGKCPLRTRSSVFGVFPPRNDQISREIRVRESDRQEQREFSARVRGAAQPLRRRCFLRRVFSKALCRATAFTRRRSRAIFQNTHGPSLKARGTVCRRGGHG